MRAVIHVAGSGEGREAAARSIADEARGRGLTVRAVEYHAPDVAPRSSLASFIAAIRVVFHYLVARARWKARHQDAVLVVTGHWYDAIGGATSRVGRDDRVLRASRVLWPLMPRASVVLVLDDNDGDRPRPGPDDDWRPWMWLQLAAWFADHLVVASVQTDDRIGGRVIDALGSNGVSSLAWASVPIARRGADVRVTLGAGASVAAQLHDPIRLRGLVSAVNRGLVGRRLCRPEVAPVDELVEFCRSCGVDADAFATLRTGKRSRLLVGAAAGDQLRLVIKLGPLDDGGLRREAQVLGREHVHRLVVPKLVWSGEWNDRYVVVTAAVRGYRQADDVRPRDVVGLCLQLAGFGGDDDLGPVVHGDLTPWNILVNDEGQAGGFVIVDWEHARFEDDPLYDLTHFVVQRASLLHRGTPASALAELTTPGSPGHEYLEARGEPPERAGEFVARYLRAARHVTTFHREMLELLEP